MFYLILLPLLLLSCQDGQKGLKKVSTCSYAARKCCFDNYCREIKTCPPIKKECRSEKLSPGTTCFSTKWKEPKAEYYCRGQCDDTSLYEVSLTQCSK